MLKSGDDYLKVSPELALCNGSLSTEDSRDSMKVTSAADLLYNKSLHECIQKDNLTSSPVESKEIKMLPLHVEADESVGEQRASLLIIWLFLSISTPLSPIWGWHASAPRKGRNEVLPSGQQLIVKAKVNCSPWGCFCKPDFFLVSSSEPGCSADRTADVLIDWSHLEAVYESCINVTAETTIDELHHLYTLLLGLTQKHSSSLDRAPLLSVSILSVSVCPSCSRTTGSAPSPPRERRVVMPIYAHSPPSREIQCSVHVITRVSCIRWLLVKVWVSPLHARSPLLAPQSHRIKEFFSPYRSISYTLPTLFTPFRGMWYRW